MTYQSERKPFESRLYLENDIPTKSVAADFLIAMGFELRVPLIEQPEFYCDWDIELFHEGIPKHIEVERKLSWQVSGAWQEYETVDVPYRKKESKADFFIMINKNFDTLCVCPMQIVQESVVGKKKTKYTLSGTEKFYQCPLNIFFFYRIIKLSFGNWWEPFNPKTGECS